MSAAVRPDDPILNLVVVARRDRMRDRVTHRCPVIGMDRSLQFLVGERLIGSAAEDRLTPVRAVQFAGGHIVQP